jgi:hypothetical protein
MTARFMLRGRSCPMRFSAGPPATLQEGSPSARYASVRRAGRAGDLHLLVRRSRPLGCRARSFLPIES